MPGPPSPPPLLLSDWLTATPRSARDIAVEMGPGQAGEFGFDGITARVGTPPGHLVLSDFKMRTFGGLVDGLLDLHLGRAGSFNGALSSVSQYVQVVWPAMRARATTR